MCTNDNQTALHLAVHQGNLRVVERLVGYGAELNRQDGSGDTPLHVALVRESAEVLTADTPQLKKVSVYIVSFSFTHVMCVVYPRHAISQRRLQ